MPTLFESEKINEIYTMLCRIDEANKDRADTWQNEKIICDHWLEERFCKAISNGNVDLVVRAYNIFFTVFNHLPKVWFEESLANYICELAEKELMPKALKADCLQENQFLRIDVSPVYHGITIQIVENPIIVEPYKTSFGLKFWKWDKETRYAEQFIPFEAFKSFKLMSKQILAKQFDALLKQMLLGLAKTRNENPYKPI